MVPVHSIPPMPAVLVGDTMVVNNEEFVMRIVNDTSKVSHFSSKSFRNQKCMASEIRAAARERILSSRRTIRSRLRLHVGN